MKVHHNTACPEEPIIGTCADVDGLDRRRSTSYTEVGDLEDGHLLVIYKRLANGWHAISEDSQNSNSIWVVRVGIQLKP